MLTTKRKPATIGGILEYMEPLGLAQATLPQAIGVPCKHVSKFCNNRGGVTAATALFLPHVFGNAADLWLNIQRRTNLWHALHDPKERARIERARPLEVA